MKKYFALLWFLTYRT